MYALQMWMFFVEHELPYDDPEAVRRRLRVGYPIRVDRALGGGQLPNVRLQRALEGLGRRNAVDRILSWVHWAWFIEPHAALTWILARDPEHFARSARQVSAVFDLAASSTRRSPRPRRGGPPPRAIPTRRCGGSWWRSARRSGRAWPVLYDALGGNPWAAMPSLHFATSLMAAFLLAEAGPMPGAAGWLYAGTLGLALVYLGEHYLVDLLAGAAIVIAVRRGERYVEPVAQAVSRGLQRLERIAGR